MLRGIARVERGARREEDGPYCSTSYVSLFVSVVQVEVRSRVSGRPES